MSQGVFVSNFEWKYLAAVFSTHLARTLGMFCGILNQTHVANSHTAFGQLFWCSGKCVFVQKVLTRIIQNTPRKGPFFGQMVRHSPMITHLSRASWVLMFFLDMMWCDVQTLKGKTKTKKGGGMRASHVILLNPHACFYFWKYFHAAQKHLTQVRSNH